MPAMLQTVEFSIHENVTIFCGSPFQEPILICFSVEDIRYEIRTNPGGVQLTQLYDLLALQ